MLVNGHSASAMKMAATLDRMWMMWSEPYLPRSSSETQSRQTCSSVILLSVAGSKSLRRLSRRTLARSCSLVRPRAVGFSGACRFVNAYLKMAFAIVACTPFV